MNATNDDSGDKLLGIELLRFASAVAVLIFHFQHFAYVGQQQVGFIPNAQPFYSALKLFYDYGFYGVQVFWCISGFIFYWKYAATIATQKIGAYPFFILRLSRLYPLHLVTLLFVAAAQMAYFQVHGAHFVYPYNDGYHFLLQLFMASNWGWQVGDSFNGPIWSISVEVLVYTFFFISLRWLSASPKALLSIITAAAGVIILKLSTHPFFYCVMFFYMGCLTAYIYTHTRRSLLWKKLVTAAAIVALLAMPFALYLLPIRPLDFLIVYAPALIFICVTYFRPTGAGVALTAAAGNITYASYLLHVPIQISICLFASAELQLVMWQSPAFFLGYLLGTLAISLLCYTYFEMPAQKMVRCRWLLRSATAVKQPVG